MEWTWIPESCSCTGGCFVFGRNLFKSRPADSSDSFKPGGNATLPLWLWTPISEFRVFILYSTEFDRGKRSDGLGTAHLGTVHQRCFGMVKVRPVVFPSALTFADSVYYLACMQSFINSYICHIFWFFDLWAEHFRTLCKQTEKSADDYDYKDRNMIFSCFLIYSVENGM